MKKMTPLQRSKQEITKMPLISFWTKSRRAQNDTDYETWIQGGVTPTLNAFDNATETRATVLIIDGTRVNDVRVYEDGIVPTVISRYGTGGGNVPMIFDNNNEPIVMRDREGCAGGGQRASAIRQGFYAGIEQFSYSFP